MDTPYTMHYAVFSENIFCVYYAQRIIFFCVDTAYTMHYAVFSGDRYNLYQELRSFSGEIYLYYPLRSIFGE